MRNWAVARYDLGLSSEEFFACTPRQLDALIRRHERKVQETEFMFAQLGTLVVNFSMARPKEAIQPKDLMPSEWAKSSPVGIKKTVRRSRKKIATEVRWMMDIIMKGQNG